MFINALLKELEQMAVNVYDDSFKQIFSALLDAVHDSDPVSSSGVAATERIISAKTVALSSAVESKNTALSVALCDEIHLLLTERSRLIKLRK